MIDDFLNHITMYRLVLYYLIGLVGLALVYSILGVLAFNPAGLLFSVLFLILVSWVTNLVFARIFKVPVNIESIFISALILVLIITPARSFQDTPFLFWAGVWTAAGKFILARNGKHAFNPAALGVFLPAVFLGESASWWVGNAAMALPVLIGGWAIVRKIRREKMVGVFLAAAMMTILAANFFKGPDPWNLIQKTFLETPILFFALVMLTEPLTTPPTKNFRLLYAVLTGILFAPQFHLGGFYTTPESALLIGNVFSYLVSPRWRAELALVEKNEIAPGIYSFIFSKDRRINFQPGQYLEWTIRDDFPDLRGNRRYFTVASSPTEEQVGLGIKFNSERSSSFKQKLLTMNQGERIWAGQLAGDFTLPADKNMKLVLVAGGIGVTPFRSMVKYLLDRGERREIVLFFITKTAAEVVYREIFQEAEEKLGMKVVYVETAKEGHLNSERITREVPDFKERIFYLSGPQGMVMEFEKTLKEIGVSGDQVKTDYFPGFA